MTKCKLWKVVCLGTLIGVINGFFGAGGGMIVVPVLSRFFGFDEKTAHATAIFVILPISIASSIIYITRVGLTLSTSWWTILGVSIGGALGAILLSRVRGGVITLIFVTVMLAAGIYLLVG